MGRHASKIKTGAKKPEVDFMVLPIRLPRDHVAQLDETCQMLGYRSRSQFFRTATCRLLSSEG